MAADGKPTGETTETVTDMGVPAVRRLVKRCPECKESYSADSMFCPFDGTALEDGVWIAPTDPTVDPLLGVVVDGRYKVERVLGEGGTGTVYDVLHQALGRRFAMKVLRRDVAHDTALASRFIQEARATASLKHAHIVSISDFGHLPDQTPYFVMERLTGQTLAEVCKASGPLPLDRAVQIVMQVAGALATAHEAGIVHRDLKPENLFLVGRSDTVDASLVPGLDDVRVVDFGAAKIAGGTRITKTGIVFGTPHYMSPEQASGQPVDHRADIYALGVIMYELFTGHRPFESDTLMGVLTKHMFQEPPGFAEPATDADAHADAEAAGTPLDERRRLLGGLEAVTLRALAKKPELRIQTMTALVEELERTVTFDASGHAVLAAGWQPRTQSRPGRSIAALPRAVEGADRADIYPSGDLPILPQTAWFGGARGGAFIAAFVVAFAAVVAFMALRHPVSAVPVAAAGAPSSAGSAAPDAAPPTTLHLVTTPAFAEVWQDGLRTGTTPIDLAIDPTGLSTRCTLRAPGYADRALVFDRYTVGTNPSMQVTLDPAATQPPIQPATQPTAPKKPPPSPAHRRRKSDGELVDPFSR